MKSRPFSRKSTARMKTRQLFLIWLSITGTMMLAGCSSGPENAIETNTRAHIFPEYYDLTIPPNIAPLNFVIREPGSKFRVEISAVNGIPIVLEQRSPKIQIPLDGWKKLLSKNAGATLQLEIWSLQHHEWMKYSTIHHTIAPDLIDPYLAYRLVYAVYLKWHEMGIYQRNLTNFEEFPVIENASTDHGCMNCHSFSNHDPSKMLIHFRILHAGTLLWNDGKLSKIDTRTPNTPSAGIYPAWHPDGKHIAFSTGKISPHLTTRFNKVVDVADRVSDLMVYDVETNRVTTSPGISTERRENMPVWSADGKYLYFISAPEAIKGDEESLLHSKYSLMRIAYDPDQNLWGEAEMVLNSDSTGMSTSMPSVSPDGKYLVCSMSDYGYFTIFHKKSDLYSVDLETKEYRKLEINSSSAESYSTWASNSRWLVFSSKRIDDVFTRPFIAYIDEHGAAHTPFVMPQEDPEMYDRLLANYNRPELITGKIELTPVQVRNTVFSDPKKVNPDN
jgi:hypothetical protein